MVSKTLERLLIQTWARLQDDVELRFGNNDNFTVDYDSNNNVLSVEHTDGTTWQYSPGGGVVGTGSDTGVYGVDGTLVELFSGSSRQTAAFSDTSYTSQIDAVVPNYPYNHATINNVYLTGTCLSRIDTSGESTFLRLGAPFAGQTFTGTEVEVTSTSYTGISFGTEVYNPSDPTLINVEGRVTDGAAQGVCDRMTVQVLGEIG